MHRRGICIYFNSRDYDRPRFHRDTKRAAASVPPPPPRITMQHVHIYTYTYIAYVQQPSQGAPDYMYISCTYVPETNACLLSPRCVHVCVYNAYAYTRETISLRGSVTHANQRATVLYTHIYVYVVWCA